jgi:NTP pyrophosphatase (non-canonical NTP hydrolase)
MADQPSALEWHHRRALAREMTAAAGYPLRDRYGYAARDADVDWLLCQLLEEPDDKAAAEAIGSGNTTGRIELARAPEEAADQEYELGIVSALRPLIAPRQHAVPPAPRREEDTDPRELLGRLVRAVFVAWAREQPGPKPSWLTEWDELDKGQREVDMRIGAALAAAGRAAERQEHPSPERMARKWLDTARQAGCGPWTTAFWLRLLLDEVRELADAIAARDLVAIADALADIAWVVAGSAVQLGIPFDKVLGEVSRSNMTKLIPPIRLRADGKIIKGPHFEPPGLDGLLDGLQ